MIRTITPIFSIVVALVIFFFFSKPMFAEIKLLQGETTQYQEAVTRATELNAELSSKLSQKRSYPAEALEKLEALVPSEIDEVRILNDLNEMARSHNMLFGNVTVSPSKEEATEEEGVTVSRTISYDTLTATDITFSLIGTYDQFKQFLGDMEKSLVMLEVLNIGFSPAEGMFSQYALSVRVFALPPVEDIE
jgi:hypothetical protein